MQYADIPTKRLMQTLYDFPAGTGAMGSVAQEYLKELNPTANSEFFAQ